jgi:penicillin-binding protein-related factor A (putative recombinase)
MNEKQLQQQIVDYLKARGIWHYVTHRAMFPPPPENKGIPDICGIYKGKPLYIEVKGPRGKIGQEQTNFITNVKEQGGIAFFAWSMDDVLRELDLPGFVQ